MRIHKKPYSKGLKAFLVSFEVGEIRDYPEEFDLESLRSTSRILGYDYGCKFSFKKIGGVRKVKRIA